MKDYYEILGVPKFATFRTIEGRYNRLVKRYTLGENANHNSEAILQELQEAYEVLSNPEKKGEYDALVQSLNPEAYETYGAWIKRAKIRYKPVFIWVCRVGLIFSFVVGLDVLLPPKKTEETVVEVAVQRFRKGITRQWVYTYHREFLLYPDHSFLFAVQEGNTYNLEVSRILNTVLAIKPKGEDKRMWVAKIYTQLSIFPICTFLASVVALYYKDRIDVVINCCGAVLVMGFFTLFFL